LLIENQRNTMVTVKKPGSSQGFNKPTRNRGESIGTPQAPKQGYDYMPENQYTDRAQERATRRYEVRNTYETFYNIEQDRDQRAYDRLTDMQNEFYAGVDPRRRNEIADGGMVREDHHAMANLPRKAIHCEYPQAPFYTSNFIDNSLRGVTKENDDDGDSMARFKNPYKSAKTPD